MNLYEYTEGINEGIITAGNMYTFMMSLHVFTEGPSNHVHINVSTGVHGHEPHTSISSGLK